jgi:hypothetical protein
MTKSLKSKVQSLKSKGGGNWAKGWWLKEGGA